MPDPAVAPRLRPVHGRAAFARFRRSRTVRSGYLRVRFVAGPSPDVAVAYQVGRSVGGAVVRNRLRRRLRAAVRDLSHLMPAGQYLVAPAPPMQHLTYPAMVDTLHDCLTQLQVAR